jgi:putative heme-binding domain-containing protein
LHPGGSSVGLAGAVLLGLVIGLVTPATAADSAKPTDSNRTANALEALSRLKGIDLEANPGVKGAVLKLLDQTRGTPQFVEIVRDFNIKGQEAGLLDFAGQNPASSAGADAMRIILNGPNDALLKNSLAGPNALNLVEALGNTGEKGIVPLLKPIVTGQGRDLAIRKQAVRALAQVQAGAGALLDLAQEDKLPADLRLTVGSVLNNARWADLKSRAAQLLPPPQGQDAKPLPPISELVKQRGDRVNGAAVFRRDTVSCIKCHQINGEGIEFGPNLSEIGTKLGKDALYEAILDPSAGIAFGFEGWQITLKNGDDASGLLVNETPDELALKTVGGIVTRYRKTDVATRTQQKVSIMPAGLQQTMSLQELTDVVEYLASLKK